MRRGFGWWRRAWVEYGGRLSGALRSWRVLDDRGEVTGTVLALSPADVRGTCFAERDSHAGRLKLKRADCSPCGRGQG